MRTVEVTRAPTAAPGTPPNEFLTAGNLAAMLRAASLPCVTLTTEDAAAAGPTSTAEEGLRIVAGSFPVRVLYAAPPGSYAASRRRDSHLLWLASFAEDHRWSARWLASGWMTIHPEPWPATYMHDGHEVFRATGRRVDENLGSHVVFWIVEDAGAWADAIVDEVAAEIARAPKNRRFTTCLQQQRLESARRILVAGPRRTVRSTEHSKDRADEHVASLVTGCPNPGVRYETAPITATGACVTCCCPTFEAGAQWWHHTGGYPAECPGRREDRSLPLEPGDWEISDIDMTCGYCGQCVSWPETQRSWARLTGVHSLGVHRQTGELVVLAEVIGIAARPGETGHLAHHCTEIPDSIRAEYAAEIRAVTEGVTLQ